MSSTNNIVNSDNHRNDNRNYLNSYPVLLLASVFIAIVIYCIIYSVLYEGHDMILWIFTIRVIL